MPTPTPANLHIAPLGKSWHGNQLQSDTDGLACYPALTEREQVLAWALENIVLEVMHYSPEPRIDTSSHLPECLVSGAQHALGLCGMRRQPTQKATP